VDPSEIRARLLQRQQYHDQMSALDRVRRFARIYCSDADGLDGLRADLQRSAQRSPAALERDLAAIEALLADPPAERELVELVTVDANTPLDELTAAAAAAWLRRMAELIRAAIASVPPPPPAG